MLEALTALCVAGLVTAAIRGYLVLRGKRVAAQRFYRDGFYDIAEHIYSNKDLSDDKLDQIRQMVNDLDDPRSFDKLWKVARLLEKSIRAERRGTSRRAPGPR